MRKLKTSLAILSIMCAVTVFSGCTQIRDIVDSYEAPTEPIKTTNEGQYTVVSSESEILDMLLSTMKENKTTCYFNVEDEKLIAPDEWNKKLEGTESINIEYSLASSGYNVFVTLKYWDNYPIVAAFEKNDTTILNATQLELFNKYCDILGSCTSNSYTQYQNELAIHDYIVSNVKYDSSLQAKGAYDAIVKGYALCDGYAESFKTLLDMLKIENKFVTGTAKEGAHCWNKVMLDGEWYNVDVTFDDPVGGGNDISHKYFNVTDGDLAIDHTWDNELLPVADAVTYSYYEMNGTYKVHSQKELDDYIDSMINEKAEKIEVILYGEFDVAKSLSDTGIAMNVTYNMQTKKDCKVYDIMVSYK